MHMFLYICPGLLVNTLKIYNLDLCSSSNTQLGKLAIMQGRASSHLQNLGSMDRVTTMWDKLIVSPARFAHNTGGKTTTAKHTYLRIWHQHYCHMVVGLQFRTCVQVSQHHLLWGHSFGVPLKSIGLLQSVHFAEGRLCTHFRSQ